MIIITASVNYCHKSMELDEMIDKLRVRKKDTAAGAGQSIYGNGKIAGWVIEKEKPE